MLILEENNNQKNDNEEKIQNLINFLFSNNTSSTEK